MYLVFRDGQLVNVPLGALRSTDQLQGADGVWRPASAYAGLIPAVTPPTTPALPWGKILLGAAAGAAAAAFGVWAYKRAAADPEVVRIKQLAKAFERDGAEVAADIKGWPQPRLTNGRRLDVLADYPDGTVVAVEVENDRSIHRRHARDQIDDATTWAARSSRREFYVEVVDGGRGGKS